MTKATATIITVFIITWLAIGATAFYDMYLFYVNAPTLSDKLTLWGGETHPIFLVCFCAFFYAPFCFVAGLLIGHWFWPNGTAK